MLRITLLTAVSVLAVSAAHAETVAPSVDNNSPTKFQAAIQSIKSWFGSDSPVTVTPIATNDDAMAPVVAGSMPNPNDIEPAAGDDMLQVPPPYIGPGGMNAVAPAAGEPAVGGSPAACSATTEDSTICEAPSDAASTADAPVDATTPRAPAEPASQPEAVSPAAPLPTTQPAAGDAAKPADAKAK